MRSDDGSRFVRDQSLRVANPDHVAVIREGAKAIEEWREQTSSGGLNLVGADLTGLDLSGADLRSCQMEAADLSGANLRGADFQGSHLFRCMMVEADLRGANLGISVDQLSLEYEELGRVPHGSGVNLGRSVLCGADFRGATMRSTTFFGSDLSRVRLAGADLTGTSFEHAHLGGADLRGANFAYAYFRATVFHFVDFSQSEGLLDAEVSGPCPTSFESSRTLSPEVRAAFLRRCGYPEEYIEQLPAIAGSVSPIDFYSVFISHSAKDKDFARRLYNDLQGEGVRCWLDEHEILPGDRIEDRIDQGIRHWDYVLLCCSESALGDESWWVDDEIGRAFRKELRLTKERGRRVDCLIPLDLDGYLLREDWNTPWKDRIVGRNAADFVGWKDDHDTYKESFKRVLKKLRADAGARRSPPESKL